MAVNGDTKTTTVQVGAGKPLTRRARLMRSVLIQSAREVFEDVGLTDARVADITTRAGKSYGSFYTYFDSKEEIFREVVKQVSGEMFTATARSDGGERRPTDRIEGGIRRYLAAYRANARILGRIEEVAPYDSYARDLLVGIRTAFSDRNESAIRQLQERDIADRELDVSIAASALGGMVEQFARNAFLIDSAYDEDKVVSTLTTLWARALGVAL